MKKTILLPLTAGLLLASGCGTKQETANTGSPTEAAVASNTTQPSSSTPTIPSAPKEVVQLFLDSMRAGNGARLSSLLSSLAREEIKRKQLEIAPLGSPNAVFNVGEAAEQDGGMLVSSSWTEPEQPGQPATKLEVVWELRKEAEGWRICGMAVDPLNGDEVQIVDFERLEPEQPAQQQDPSRVASLPNAPTGFPSNAGMPNGAAPINNMPVNNMPVNNMPANNFAPNNPPNNFAPSGNLPPANYQPAGFQQPANYQPPAANYQPANNSLPPAGNYQPGLPPAAGNQPSGSPQPAGQNMLPPIVPGNAPTASNGFSLPPASNPQPPRTGGNPIQR